MECHYQIQLSNFIILKSYEMYRGIFFFWWKDKIWFKNTKQKLNKTTALRVIIPTRDKGATMQKQGYRERRLKAGEQRQKPENSLKNNVRRMKMV